MSACKHTAFIAKLRRGWAYKTCRDCKHSWSEPMPAPSPRKKLTVVKR
ncbi:hypothetical protein [Amycolatopsis sp. FDAARGOS 1241]|nr:hypothetical protein [Amycolatopsis sp. FDAARGOS 1241]QRP47417.1 hypothetical protein I6J71_05465 [Amycolatopsis sp. FDAARGOS 1241]